MGRGATLCRPRIGGGRRGIPARVKLEDIEVVGGAAQPALDDVPEPRPVEGRGRRTRTTPGSARRPRVGWWHRTPVRRVACARMQIPPAHSACVSEPARQTHAPIHSGRRDFGAHPQLKCDDESFSLSLARSTEEKNRANFEMRNAGNARRENCCKKRVALWKYLSHR